MAALDEVRAKEIEIDMDLNPIEECYSFLQRCGVAVAREEMETVDSLRYTFKNLLTQAVHSSYLISYANSLVSAGSGTEPLDWYPTPVQNQSSGKCGSVPPRLDYRRRELLSSQFKYVLCMCLRSISPSVGPNGRGSPPSGGK